VGSQRRKTSGGVHNTAAAVWESPLDHGFADEPAVRQLLLPEQQIKEMAPIGRPTATPKPVFSF